MATVAELKAVLRDTLEKRGALGHLKAQIRAEVFGVLDDDQEPRPTLSHENLLINELIQSGQPPVPLDRQFLIRELNAFEESKDNTIPILYGILGHLSKRTTDDFPSAFAIGSSHQSSSLGLNRQAGGRKKRGGRPRTEKENPHVSPAVKR